MSSAKCCAEKQKPREYSKNHENIQSDLAINLLFLVKISGKQTTPYEAFVYSPKVCRIYVRCKINYFHMKKESLELPQEAFKT